MNQRNRERRIDEQRPAKPPIDAYDPFEQMFRSKRPTDSFGGDVRRENPQRRLLSFFSALSIHKACAKEAAGAAKAGSGNHVTEELFARRSCKPRAAHA